MPQLLASPTRRASEAARAIVCLSKKAAHTYASIVPANYALCTLCAHIGILTVIEATTRSRTKHFKTHSTKDVQATEDEVYNLLEKAPPAKEETGPMVAIVHDSPPYSFTELRRGSTSSIVTVSTSGPANVPDEPHLAKLKGKLLVSAPTMLPALLCALEQQATTFWPWFQNLCKVQCQRPADETRVFTGTWSSLVKAIENYNAHASNTEAEEVLHLFGRITDQPDAAVHVIELYQAANKGLRWTEGGFTMHPISYGFSTAVAQDAERAVFAVIIEAAKALTENDLLCVLVHMHTARRAKNLLDDAAAVLLDLHTNFKPSADVPEGFWSADDEIETWLKFRPEDEATWNQLRPTFRRIAHMASATALLGAPSAYVLAQLDKAAEYREQPALYQEAITGRKRTTAPAPAPEPKREKDEVSEQPLKAEEEEVKDGGENESESSEDEE